MGRPGDCVMCYGRKRQEIEAARAKGESYASLARRFGLAESSMRRHFKDGHAREREPRTAPRPAAPTTATPRYQSGPTRGSVPFAAVKQAAALLGVPLHALTMCLSEHSAFDITVTGDDDEEVLYQEFDRAAEDQYYTADVARHGSWLAGNGA